jgi:benzoyl-CoA reductase subunit C
MISDMTTPTMKIAEGLYKDYGSRVRDLKKQGKKIIGYLCSLTPIEIIDAAGFIPFRIKGDVNERITAADTQIETLVCPLVRSAYDVVLKNKYDFIEGIVIPHSCDSVCRTYDIWKSTPGFKFSHLINVPHTSKPASLEFYRNLLVTFRKALGEYAGKEISDKDIKESIKKYNQYRSIVRKLYDLRKQNPPLITGSQIAKILIAGMSLPVNEATDMITKIINEVKTEAPKNNKNPRLMIIGAELDSAAFIELVEDSGAAVVTDDLCPGLREYEEDVASKSDPIAAIAERYLLKIKCARTFREPSGNYQKYQEDRFGHLTKRVKNFKVDGVILYFYRFCDPFGFEVPSIKSYLEGKKTPVFYLEGDYSMADAGRIRTRIQAFIEQVEQVQK